MATAHGPPRGRRAEDRADRPARAGLRGLKAGRPGPDGPAFEGRGSAGRSSSGRRAEAGRRPRPSALMATAHGPARGRPGGRRRAAEGLDLIGSRLTAQLRPRFTSGPGLTAHLGPDGGLNLGPPRAGPATAAQGRAHLGP